MRKEIAERVVIGTILEDNDFIGDSGLIPEHFSEAVNKNIFSLMKRLAEEGKSFDMVGLIMNTEEINGIGGASYLAETQNFANPAKFTEYCMAVLDHWKYREKNRILQSAVSEDWTQEEVMKKLGELETASTGDLNSIDDLIAESYEDPFIERLVNPGAPSGLKHLDDMTNGWQESDLVIVAARPSVGKTDVLLHFAKHAGWEGRLPIIFSLEMSAKKLKDRLIAGVGRISRSKMNNPFKDLSDEQKNQWGATTGKVSMTKIQIYDSAAQPVAEMRAKIRKSMTMYPDRKPIVFIDYLTLIKPAEKLSNNHLQVGAITKALKGIAKEFECTVVVLAQLSRGVEQRQDKRPMLSDLRESGSIEEDADVAIFLYRESYYDKENDDNTMELIVAKNRNGATGTVIAAYNKVTGGLGNIEYSSQY